MDIQPPAEVHGAIIMACSAAYSAADAWGGWVRVSAINVSCSSRCSC